MNEKGSKTELSSEHQQDATNIPRFFRTGVPKTPLQEQDWYVPLTSEGRFDWRENIRRNGYTASLFSKRGWDQRFHLYLNRPGGFVFTINPSGLRHLSQGAIHFRRFELPLSTRVIRGMSSSTFDRHWIITGLYCGMLALVTGSSAHCMYFQFYFVYVLYFLCLFVRFCKCTHENMQKKKRKINESGLKNEMDEKNVV